jgi:hypothetical protein
VVREDRMAEVDEERLAADVHDAATALARRAGVVA